jgi:hypothetical protein
MKEWDFKLQDSTKDLYKVILRFLWDNPKARSLQIIKFIGQDYELSESYPNQILVAMKRKELIRQPFRGHWEITDKGMLVIGLTPVKFHKPLLELPKGIVVETGVPQETISEAPQAPETEEKPQWVVNPVSETNKQEIVVDPKRQMKITITIDVM